MGHILKLRIIWPQKGNVVCAYVFAHTSLVNLILNEFINYLFVPSRIYGATIQIGGTYTLPYLPATFATVQEIY